MVGDEKFPKLFPPYQNWHTLIYVYFAEDVDSDSGLLHVYKYRLDYNLCHSDVAVSACHNSACCLNRRLPITPCCRLTAAESCIYRDTSHSNGSDNYGIYLEI